MAGRHTAALMRARLLACCRSVVLRGAGSSAMQPLMVAALEMAGGQGRAQAQDFDISYDALGTGGWCC